jgi:ribose transport system substrate-binding protein
MLNGVCKVRKRIGVIAAVVAICGAVAACGSTSSGSSSSSSGSSSSGGSGGSSSSNAAATSGSGASSASGAVAKAQATVAALYKGTDRPLPKSGPKAQAGKSVWVISCYEAAPGCAVPAQGFVAASAHLGWKTTVVDAKLDPGTVAREINSAVAAKANAVVLDGFPCAWAPGALASAKAAGVKVYGLNSFDCPGKGLYDGQLLFGKETYQQFLLNDVGAGIAAYVIDKTNGKGNVLAMQYNDGGAVNAIGQGFENAIKQNCPGCTFTSFAVTGQDIVQNQLQSLTSSALTRDPTANVVMSPVDSTILLGMGSAVTQAEAGGRHILLTGVEGFGPNLKLIAAGGPDNFAIGAPELWAGWAAADGLNRVFAGAPQVDAGIGLQAIDKQHPSPSGVANYNGNQRSQGYEQNYIRIWTGK